MNNLVYVGNNLKEGLYFLKQNPNIKINGIYETKKNFALGFDSDEKKLWFETGNFISITTQNKYDDLSSVFMLDSNDDKYSSANYLNSLVNFGFKLVNIDNAKNLTFFNNKNFATYKNINDVKDVDDFDFSFDESKDNMKRTAFMVAELYNYCDLTHGTNFFNDKLRYNRNYACNYLKKLFREKKANQVIANLDLLSELNKDDSNNSELKEKINVVKKNLIQINKQFDNSILSRVKEFVSLFEEKGYDYKKEALDNNEDDIKLLKEATFDSKELKALYNRLNNYNKTKEMEAKIIEKQAFGRNAKEILNNIKYDEIKAKRKEYFDSTETYSPNEYKGLIPDWLIDKCNLALKDKKIDDFYNLKANYFNSFFEKAEKELNRRYDLLDYIENTPILTLSVHKGKERVFIQSLNQKDWYNPKTMKNYKNEEKYIGNVPKDFQNLKRFIGYKLEWVESGKNWVDEYGIDVLDSNGNPIKKPLFDEAGNIMTDDNGFPIFEGKFTKVPYSCLTGRKTGSNKPADWCTYEEAVEGIRKFGLHGLSIELGGEGNERLIGLDIDHIYNEDGTTTFEAHEIVNQLMGVAWLEKSISGTGLHAIIMGNFQVPDRQKRVGNFEMYSEDRAFTISGNSLNLELNKREGLKAFREIHKKYMSKPLDKEVQVGEGNTIKIKYKDEKEKYPIETILQRASYFWEQKKGANNGINKFDDIFNGNYEGYFNAEDKQSPADYWLINQVRYYGATPKQCDEIMRMSGLYRDKWDSIRGKNESYGSTTIYNVFADNKKVYDPLAFIKNKKQQEKTQSKKEDIELER